MQFSVRMHLYGKCMSSIFGLPRLQWNFLMKSSHREYSSKSTDKSSKSGPISAKIDQYTHYFEENCKKNLDGI